MSEFGRKIRPGMPPETPAEENFLELTKPEADKEFIAAFPLDKVPQMIKDSEDQEEMEGIETIRGHAKYREKYLTGAIEIIHSLLSEKIFRHSSTLQEIYNYFEQAALKLQDQSLPEKTRAKDTNTVYALRTLLELMEDGYPADLDYLKVCKILATKLKDIKTALDQPEL
jgi:hypothetical protein